MRKYTVEYMTHSAGGVEEVTVQAKSKAEAYDKAVYEMMTEMPYAAWVASVTYSNGSVKRFNTFAGNPY